MTRVTLVLAVSIALFAACDEFDFDDLVREERTLTADHVAGGALDVRTANGSVTVEREARADVQIEAEIAARSQERLDEIEVVVEREDDRTLAISIRWPEGGRRGSESASLTIAIPDVDGVEIATSNGSITVEGLAGEADLETSNGSVTVEDHDGEVSIETSNGRVEASGVDGDIEADTSNGRIEIDGATGSVLATTSNGGIDIRLDDASAGPVEARTSNGAIDLEVGGGFTGVLTVQTANGSIDIEVPGTVEIVERSTRRAELDFGGSGDSVARSSNGRISVRAE